MYSERKLAKGQTITLADQTGNWPTPNAERPDKKNYPRHNPTLAGKADAWPTPRTSDTNGPGTHGDGGTDLRTKAAMWPTPMANDDNKSLEAHMRMRQTKLPGGPRNTVTSLQVASKVWNTPKASADKMGQPREQPRGDLQAQTVNWATPTSRDWKDGADPSPNAPTNALLGRQGPRMTTDGDGSSTDSQRPRRQLNPEFVEWLMGFPIGWTGSGCSGTRLSLSLLRWRSYISALGLD